MAQTLDAAKTAAKTYSGTVAALRAQGMLFDDGSVICPGCGRNSPKGKFKIHPDGGWKHHSAGCYGDGISVLTGAGISFPDAVRWMAGLAPVQGLPDRARSGPPPGDAPVERPVTVDTDLLDGLLTFGRKTGGVPAAAGHYAARHISAEAVTESKAVLITDPHRLDAAMRAHFGLDRLLAAGTHVIGHDGKPRALISPDYPILEPHLCASGRASYIQLRASAAQHAKWAAHKAGHGPYVPKFLSLKGVPASAQVGIGLQRLATVPASTTVYVVEGMADWLASRTLGVEAYGVPGVGFRPPPAAVEILADKNVVITLDGDDAGEAATHRMVNMFTAAGVSRVDVHRPAHGWDICDALIARYASRGCPCPACAGMRATYGLTRRR